MPTRMAFHILPTLLRPFASSTQPVGVLIVPPNRGTASLRRFRVYFETYGCQMNHSDTEVAKSLLAAAGFQQASSIAECGTVLLMTCSIRESAELKIWKRLQYLRSLSRRKNLNLKIGVLGCMAERLKDRLLSSVPLVDESSSEGTSDSTPEHLHLQGADFVCGPDAYRHLPHLIEDAYAGLQGASVALSLEETYADVQPVRRCCSPGTESNDRKLNPFAFISVMRGCDNMCTYCIVPFVRGRERSRPLSSVVQEAKQLFEEGVREITLLGQNVNSYCDRSDSTGSTTATHPNSSLTPGFKTVYRVKQGGLRFVDLLDEVSAISPELRVRFTSPHPKDFPKEVLQLIGERPNICSHLHLPAQSGSGRVLENMRRGYTPEAYRELVSTVRHLIPNVSLTSDFIAGFCGETEEDHLESVRLIDDVGYAYTFCYPYSMREKTRAYHRLVDDVPSEVKQRRHLELKFAGRQASLRFNEAQIGRICLVLVEGQSRRSADHLFGRNDHAKVIIPRSFQPDDSHGHAAARNPVVLSPGDYVTVEIQHASSQTLHGRVLRKCLAQEFYETMPLDKPQNSIAVCCA